MTFSNYTIKFKGKIYTNLSYVPKFWEILKSDKLKLSDFNKEF